MLNCSTENIALLHLIAGYFASSFSPALLVKDLTFERQVILLQMVYLRDPSLRFQLSCIFGHVFEF